MYLPSVQVLLLAVVAITLSAQAAESAIAAPKMCAAADVGKGFCINCKTKAKCEVADSPPVPKGNCTVSGEACTVLANVATCKPFANTACTCTKPAQCDAYDPNSVLVCLSGGITVSTSCSATTKTCVDGACVTPATTTSTASPSQLCVDAPDGYAVLKPLCSRAAYCSGGNSLGTTDCPSGTYFDMNEINCMPIPPVPCAGCGTGACPDKSDCSKWYVCDGGTVLDDETCDADTPVFDIVANECVESGTCTGNANCTYASTTTAATTTTPVSTSTTTPVSTSTTTTVSTSTTTQLSSPPPTTISTSTTTTASTSTTTPVSTSTTTPDSTSTTTPVSTSTTTIVPTPTSTTTQLSSPPPTTVSTSTTTPASTSTTTPVSTSTTRPVSSSTTTPVSTSTTTPVSSSTTTPVFTSTTTPVSTSTTTPVSSSTTTTSRPAACTAANVGRRYPYAGNCKKYWSCRLVATGVHAYVESTCLGDLVFNAATYYCDTLVNVPSCALGK